MSYEIDVCRGKIDLCHGKLDLCRGRYGPPYLRVSH